MQASTPPEDFPIWVPFIAVGMWCFVNLLFSVLSGWRRLAETYPASRKPADRKFRWLSGRVGWMNYGNCLNVSTSSEGLRVSILFLFQLWSPPFLIPWSEIRNCSVSRFLWWETVAFDVGFPRVGTLRLPKKVFFGHEYVLGRR